MLIALEIERVQCHAGGSDAPAISVARHHPTRTHRYIAWDNLNRNAHDRALRELIKRANAA